MKRVGNKILFDNTKQIEKFENALCAEKGMEYIMESIFTAVGKTKRNSFEWWTRLSKYCKSDEFAAYDWMKREIEIKKKATGAGVGKIGGNAGGKENHAGKENPPRKTNRGFARNHHKTGTLHRPD